MNKNKIISWLGLSVLMLSMAVFLVLNAKQAEEKEYYKEEVEHLKREIQTHVHHEQKLRDSLFVMVRDSLAVHWDTVPYYVKEELKEVERPLVLKFKSKKVFHSEDLLRLDRFLWELQNEMELEIDPIWSRSSFRDDCGEIKYHSKRSYKVAKRIKKYFNDSLGLRLELSRRRDIHADFVEVCIQN